MKKTVYVCGDEDYSSNCEISYAGRMVIVEDGSGDEGLIGIDLLSMVELTGDMAEQFVMKGGARHDTLDALEELVRASRECIRVLVGGKVVV